MNGSICGLVNGGAAREQKLSVQHMFVQGKKNKKQKTDYSPTTAPSCFVFKQTFLFPPSKTRFGTNGVFRNCLVDKIMAMLF